VGKGVMDFASIFAQRERAGLEHFFVEHDQPEHPLESVRTSYRYLARLTF
jgi:sugar phosphate isomerase/epimerase